MSVRVSIWITLVIRWASRSGEVQQLGGPLGVVDAVGELPLDRHRLEVARDLVEHHVGVDAAGGYGHDLGVMPEVEERQSLALARHPARGVLDDVLGRLSLEITDVQHGPASSCWSLVIGHWSLVGPLHRLAFDRATAFGSYNPDQ
jgi:hypothetical protein